MRIDLLKDPIYAPNDEALVLLTSNSRCTVIDLLKANMGRPLLEARSEIKKLRQNCGPAFDIMWSRDNSSGQTWKSVHGLGSTRTSRVLIGLKRDS